MIKRHTRLKFNIDGALTHIFYIIGGGDYNPFSIGDYDFIHPEHVHWLKQTYKAYQGEYHKSFHHNLLFTHIPLQEYREIENVKEFHGSFNEPIACSKINSDLFSQMLLNRDIEGMFVGHDHDNDFTINLYGIRLNFGRVSGYNTYGDLQRGARLIELSPNGFYKSKVLEFDDRF